MEWKPRTEYSPIRHTHTCTWTLSESGNPDYVDYVFRKHTPYPHPSDPIREVIELLSTPVLMNRLFDVRTHISRLSNDQMTRGFLNLVKG